MQAPEGFELSVAMSHPAPQPAYAPPSAYPPSAYPPSAYPPPAPSVAVHPPCYPPAAGSPAAYPHSAAPVYPPLAYALPSVAELQAQQAEVQLQIAQCNQRNALLQQQLRLAGAALPMQAPGVFS